MKKLNFKPSFLQLLYLIFFLLLFSLIIFTPKLISGSFNLAKNLILNEELIEGALLGILFFLGILIVNLYKHEVFKQKELIKRINNDKMTTEERLSDAFKYIGMINVQIQEIKSIFNNTNKYPETRNEFKKVFRFYSERVLGIVNINWVLFRVINSNTQKTVTEHFEARLGFPNKYPHISNKMIIEEKQALSFTSVISNQQNLNIIVCCILPIDKISNDERIFIQAITNELTMLHVILNSTSYKKANKHVNKVSQINGL